MHFVTWVLIIALAAIVPGILLARATPDRGEGRYAYTDTDSWQYIVGVGTLIAALIASVIFGIAAIVGAAGSYGCERKANGLDREWRWGHAVGCQVQTDYGWVDFDKIRINAYLNEQEQQG